jgi:hypothetical protein
MSSRTLSKKLAGVKPGTLLVGIDLALDRKVAVVLAERAEQLIRFGFPNDRDGYDYFYRRLESARQGQQGWPCAPRSARGARNRWGTAGHSTRAPSHNAPPLIWLFPGYGIWLCERLSVRLDPAAPPPRSHCRLPSVVDHAWSASDCSLFGLEVVVSCIINGSPYKGPPCPWSKPGPLSTEVRQPFGAAEDHPLPLPMALLVATLTDNRHLQGARLSVHFADK